MELNFNSVETIPNLNASAAFQVDSGKVFKEDTDIVPVIVDDTLSYVPWGGDNALPYNILELIESDETLSTCQMFNAEVCYGSGLNYNTDECSASVRADVQDFTLDNALPSYFLGVCQDFKHFAFCVSVIILNADGTKIVRLLRKEACYCRLSPADKDGAIRQVLYANWRNAVSSREDIEVIELLDINSPWRDLAIRMGRIAGDDGRTAIRTSYFTGDIEEFLRNNFLTTMAAKLTSPKATEFLHFFIEANAQEYITYQVVASVYGGEQSA